MVQPASFNNSYIIDWVRKKLGDPTIQIELDETQIEQSIDDVMELFMIYRPVENNIGKQYGRGHYLLDPPTGAIGVLDVEFVRNDFATYESVEGALLYDPFYFLSAGGITGIDIQTYDLVRHWLEIISREFGSEEGYLLLDDGRVFLQVPGTFDVTIKWAMPWTGLGNIHRPYQQLFLNLTLAKSRQILGHIRAKFSQGVPGAGTMVQMDGEYQREKGATDEEKFTDELIRTSPHFLPSMG